MLKYSFFKDKILNEKGQEIMMDWETPLMEKHAKVVTENGVVYLMGLVTQAEANWAVGIASNASGIQRIVKVFEYID